MGWIKLTNFVVVSQIGNIWSTTNLGQFWLCDRFIHKTIKITETYSQATAGLKKRKLSVYRWKWIRKGEFYDRADDSAAWYPGRGCKLLEADLAREPKTCIVCRQCCSRRQHFKIVNLLPLAPFMYGFQRVFTQITDTELISCLFIYRFIHRYFSCRT